MKKPKSTGSTSLNTESVPIINHQGASREKWEPVFPVRDATNPNQKFGGAVLLSLLS